MSCLIPILIRSQHKTYIRDYAAQYNFTVDDWLGIVSAATNLQFYSIRSIAIDKILGTSSPIGLVLTGREKKMYDLFIEGIRMLCCREESLSMKEGELLRLACVIKIAQARDMAAKGTEWDEIICSIDFDIAD